MLGRAVGAVFTALSHIDGALREDRVNRESHLIHQHWGVMNFVIFSAVSSLDFLQAVCLRIL